MRSLLNGAPTRNAPNVIIRYYTAGVSSGVCESVICGLRSCICGGGYSECQSLSAGLYLTDMSVILVGKEMIQR